ncbi:MAG: PaaI family thioesterase [Acidimicrobiales bacterium]
MGATRDEATGLWRPEGCVLDLGQVWAVATQTNAAHYAMGTELLAVERHGVVLGLAWRDDLVEVVGGGLANGVLATLLDHACSLAVWLSVNDETNGGATMGARVDYFSPAEPEMGVHVRAECVHRGDYVGFVRGTVFHPERPDAVLAMGTCTVAKQP